LKKNILLLIVILIGSFIFVSCNQKNESKFPEFKGPYLGQKPPGDVPEIFAPGIIPDIGTEHTACMFTSDGKEVFWSRIINPGQPRCMPIVYMKLEKGVWGKPELAPLNVGKYNFISSVSPDGKRVHFMAYERIEEGEEITRRWTTWVVQKTDTGWGEPYLLEEDFKWGGDGAFYCHETNSGNRYFTGTLPGVEREFGYFRSKYVDGVYQKPEALDITINSEYLDYAFHIEPDEKFIIFASNRPGGFVGTELYISFHEPDGSWGPVLNLGPKINSVFEGGTDWPYLSPDGKYLFFLASVEAYHDSDVEEGTYEQLKAISQSNENGYSRIYWVNTSFVEELRTEDHSN
jgi:hypothetical protein